MEASVSTDLSQQAIVANVRGMKGWLKFLGIINIITGGLQALSIVGILWAWLPIWLGIILTQAGSKAQEYADKNDQAALAGLTGKLKTYFLISGIVMIVSLAIIALSIILAIVLSVLGTFSLVSLIGALQEQYGVGE